MKNLKIVLMLAAAAGAACWPCEAVAQCVPGDPSSDCNPPAPDGEACASAAQSIVYSAYVCILDREPDDAGLAFWTNNVVSHRDIPGLYRAFYGCDEFAAQNQNDPAFVASLYVCILNRVPDSGGFLYWLGQLKKGQTRATQVDAFVSSDEFRTQGLPAMLSSLDQACGPLGGGPRTLGR